MDKKKLRTEATITVELNEEQVAYLVSAALEGTKGDFMLDRPDDCDDRPNSEWVASALMAGGHVHFRDADTRPGERPKCWELTDEKLMTGLKRYLEIGGGCVIEDKGIDVYAVDPTEAAVILARALCGVFPWEEDGKDGEI